jgi:hypothetical protein
VWLLVLMAAGDTEEGDYPRKRRQERRNDPIILQR